MFLNQAVIMKKHSSKRQKLTNRCYQKNNIFKSENTEPFVYSFKIFFNIKANKDHLHTIISNIFCDNYCITGIFVILIGALYVNKQCGNYEIPFNWGVHYFDKYGMNYPKDSLHTPFSYNHSESLALRENNLHIWKEYHVYQMSYDLSGIDRRNNLSLQEFWDIYDGKWPVLITDVIPQWPAFNWTGEFFNKTYGNEPVTMKAVDLQLDAAIHEMFPVISGLPSPSMKSGLDSAVSLDIPLQVFYENIERATTHSWTYVVDELFIPMKSELKNDIQKSEYVKEDYFERFPEEVRPWDAMFLWGSKYSRSSLHMDPYNWTGISAVISGRKRWKLYPPGQDQYLYINNKLKSGFPLDCYKYNSPVDAFDPDLEKYPLYKNAKSILFEQLPGEMLIIPTGWYHQAYNVDETLAVSGQVMNRNNYRVVLEEILKTGDIPRHRLPHDIDSMSPEKQVQTVMSILPTHIIDRGRAVTKNIIKQKDKYRL